MIVLDGVTVARGPNPVASDLSLEIGPGRIFWIVGPNGGGKTSLLRVLAGLDAPVSGSVRLRGVSSPQSLLYMHSDARLPGPARVRHWESLVAGLLGPAATAPTALWPAVGGGRRARRVSTGEGKRLLLDPLLRRSGPLLLDEPFEHLSPDAKRELLELLRRRAEREIVVVATNQRTDLAEEDAGLWLEGGVARPLGAVTR